MSFIVSAILNFCNAQEYPNIICIETERTECLSDELKQMHETLETLINVSLTNEEISKKTKYVQAILSGGGIDYKNFYASAYYKRPDMIVAYFVDFKKNSEGERLTRILDFKIITGKIDSLTLSFQTCELMEKSNPRIMALVVASEKEYRGAVYKAWEANPISMKLESISIKGIRCPNEGW